MRTTAIRIVAFLAAAIAAPAWAAKGGGEKLPDGVQLNACGCYRDPGGSCKCVKKGKCACQGDCEPAGCEAKRQKDEDKKANAELKKIQDREKKRATQAKKKGAKGGQDQTGKSDAK